MIKGLLRCLFKKLEKSLLKSVTNFIILMPIPKPGKKEEKKQFMSRCLSDKTMRKEFKDIKQRIAVCMTSFTDKDKKDA